MEALEINGQLLAYRFRPGLGRTIVFANSLGSDQSIWDDVIAHLPRGYGVLTYDLRGHGHSGLSDTVSIQALADDVIGLVDALKITDALYCGVSIGGLIGQALLMRKPSWLTAAVLCNTAPKIGTDERWNERIAAVEANGVESIADTIIANWFGETYYTFQPARVKAHTAMLARSSRDGYAAACAAIRDTDLTAGLADIDLPVLCVGGNEDKSVPVEGIQKLAELIPGAQLDILDGVGHLPCLETPQALAERIAAFDQLDIGSFDRGMTTRRAVLGGAHVDRAEANKTDLDHAFQTLITTGAWGTVWSSPAISARERSMLTLALLAATGNFEEIPMHIRATARTGASVRDITEAMQHVAIYAGVPKANHGLKLAKATLTEMDQDAANG
ncbi:MAG: 3-oxoadipate enol-lactonase [Pseudomonadota bacterium]